MGRGFDTRNAGCTIMRRAWGLYGLLVLASVVYCASLFGGLDQWGRGDWDQFHFRYETPRRAMLVYGELPLWNPYVNGGNVLLAHPHCPAFSPWYLPTLLLGAPLGLRVSVVLMMALGTTGMAAVLRRWEVSAGGAFLGGVLLMMSAHFAMHITEGHLEWCVLGLMPWVLLCLIRAERDWRFVILGGLLLASALLYGSIYIVAVFVPVFAIWAILEGIRTLSWRLPGACAAVVGLTALLCAVVLLPRLEFLRANPRRTRQDERVSAAAVRPMLLERDQAALFRQTRDVRNPPDAELDRLLPGLYDTLQWHRLEVVLTTTSDWADVRFVGFPYRLFAGGLGEQDYTAAELNAMPQTTEWLAVKNPDIEPMQTARATLYVRLPSEGDLEFRVTRGLVGATKLLVTRGEEELLDGIHSFVDPGGEENAWTFSIPRYLIAGEPDPQRQRPAGPWYEVEATLRTTAEWCDVQVVNAPYVFHIKRWENRSIERWKDRNPTRAVPSISAMATGSPVPGEVEAVLEATLYFQRPRDDDLRVALLQGPEGHSTLDLSTPQGDPIAAWYGVLPGLGDVKTFECVVWRDDLAGLQRLGQQPEGTEGVFRDTAIPFRWQLDQWGMRYDWHEYACYITWTGLAMAALGLLVSYRRHWPLLVAGLLAGLVVLGASLPLNLWALWKQLPLFGSLQVPSRFLVAVVFVVAACGGFGVDQLARWSERIGGRWLRGLLVGGIGLVVYVELAMLGWALFSDVFVLPPRDVPRQEQFAQRMADDDAIRYPGMYSAHYPYLMANTGVLREYENIAIKRGEVRVTTDPDYRGEAYLEDSRGTAEIADWSMARVEVRVDVDAPDRLVLNQNYFTGWKALRRTADGKTERLAAEPSPEGLVSIAVRPGDRRIEFHYLPDSFVRGAALSTATLLICLGVLLIGGRMGGGLRRLVWLPGVVARRVGRVLRSPVAASVTAAVLLNVPFVICHPGWTLVDVPLVRSLAVGVVLFLAPGLPLVGVMIGRGWLRRLHLLWAIVLSLAVFAAVLTVVHLAGLRLAASTVWNGTWIVTNLAVVLNLVFRGPPAWGICPDEDRWRVGGPLFAAAYLLFFFGATRVVPPMQDHDLDIQSPAYSLLMRFTPEVVNDRGLLHYFAHPLLLNCCEGASFLYFDRLDSLARFDAATARVRRAEAGDPIEPVVSEFVCLSPSQLGRDRGQGTAGATRHRVVGVRDGNYVVEPALPQWLASGEMQEDVGELSVRQVEVQILYDDYYDDPNLLETRTPNLFLAALTVALLGVWLDRRTGLWWAALPISLAYAANPEVFVRSSYGGYFAISMFALLQILLAVERRIADSGRATWMSCLLGGLFAAAANNKLILLPAAIVLWELARSRDGSPMRRLGRAVLHPVAIGFALATAAFWVYGLAICPGDFWDDHVRFHLVNRLTHQNVFGYGGYPTVLGLWQEFLHHTGYLLLPLGVAAVAALCFRSRAENGVGASDGATTGWRGLAGLWAVWLVLTAVAFSLIDWRQTKHLMPLLLPLHLAPAWWAASRPRAMALVALAFGALLLWDLNVLATLRDGFDAFSVRPLPGW